MKIPVSKQQCVSGSRTCLCYLEGLEKNDNLPVVASQGAGLCTPATVLIPMQQSVIRKQRGLLVSSR